MRKLPAIKNPAGASASRIRKKPGMRKEARHAEICRACVANPVGHRPESANSQIVTDSPLNVISSAFPGSVSVAVATTFPAGSSSVFLASSDAADSTVVRMSLSALQFSEDDARLQGLRVEIDDEQVEPSALPVDGRGDVQRTDVRVHCGGYGLGLYALFQSFRAVFPEREERRLPYRGGFVGHDRARMFTICAQLAIPTWRALRWMALRKYAVASP